MTERSNKISGGCTRLIFLVVLFTLPVAETTAQIAQDSVQVRVMRVQGRGIYTSSDGVPWERGDTLRVYNAARDMVQARVAGKTTTTLLLAWLTNALETTVDEVLILYGPKRDGDVEAAELTPEIRPVRTSIMQPPGLDAQRSGRASSPRVSGYYSVSVSGTASTVRGQFSDRSTSRSHATPASTLRLRVEDLPGEWRFQMNGRTSRSFSSTAISGRPQTVRIYEMNVSRGGLSDRFRYELGRFNDARVPTGGYWDGLSADMALGRQRLGISIGYEPDRYSEAPSTDIAKAALTFDLSGAHMGGSSSVDGALGMINSPWMGSPLSFLALNHRTRAGSVHLFTRAQIDRSPIDQSLELSRMQARMRLDITPRISLEGRLGSRKTFFYWFDGGAYSSRRDQRSAAMTWNLDRHRFGFSIGQNAYAGLESSTSVTATATVRPRWLPFTFVNSSSRWSRRSTTTWYSSSSFQRTVGRVDLSLDYAVMVLDGLGPASISHITGMTARLPIGRSGYMALRQRVHIGEHITSSTTYFNFGVGF